MLQPAVGRVIVLQKQDGGGTRVAGMVSVLFTVSTALGGRVALLEDLVVAPEARGQGSGSALLQAAIAFAKESGALRVTFCSQTV